MASVSDQPRMSTNLVCPHTPSSNGPLKPKLSTPDTTSDRVCPGRACGSLSIARTDGEGVSLQSRVLDRSSMLRTSQHVAWAGILSLTLITISRFDDPHTSDLYFLARAFDVYSFVLTVNRSLTQTSVIVLTFGCPACVLIRSCPDIADTGSWGGSCSGKLFDSCEQQYSNFYAR